MDIKTLRTRNNWNRKKLAELCGVTALTVQRWELGYCKPSDQHFVKLNKLWEATAIRVATLKQRGKSLNIAIYQYTIPSEHNPPHFHVVCGQTEARYFLDEDALEPPMTPKIRKFVEAWVELNREAIEANWEKSMAGQRPDAISGEI